MTEELWKNSAIIAKRNVDSNQTPISVNLTELKQIIDVHSCLVLNQLPDEHYGIDIDGFTEVYDIEDVTTRSYKVDYANGVLYFHPNNIGKMLQVNYYGVGCTLLSASRIYTKYDKYGNVLETLEELLDKGKLYIQAIDALGGAVEVINRVENANATGTVLHENLLEDIEIGSELNKDLINNNHIAENTITTLIQKTETGNQTINNLTDKTNLANQKKQELEVTTSNANNKNTELNNTISTANNTDTKLKDTILSGQDSINKINATGNKSLIIGASQFINNEYTWKHDMNSEDLHVTFEDLATKLPLQPDYQRIDKNNILIRNSAEHPNIKVVLSASYYQGNALFGTNVEEFASDSIGVNTKKVRLKDGNGILENPVTDSDAVFMPDGNTKLTKKIDDISTSLKDIDKIICSIEMYEKLPSDTSDSERATRCLNENGKLYLPSNKEYSFLSPIVLKTNYIIEGDSFKTVINSGGNSVFTVDTEYSDWNWSNCVSNVSIEGLIIKSQNGDVLKFSKIFRSVFKNIFITGHNIGLQIGAGWTNSFYDLTTINGNVGVMLGDEEYENLPHKSFICNSNNFLNLRSEYNNINVKLGYENFDGSQIGSGNSFISSTIQFAKNCEVEVNSFDTTCFTNTYFECKDKNEECIFKIGYVKDGLTPNENLNYLFATNISMINCVVVGTNDTGAIKAIKVKYGKNISLKNVTFMSWSNIEGSQIVSRKDLLYQEVIVDPVIFDNITYINSKLQYVGKINSNQKNDYSIKTLNGWYNGGYDDSEKLNIKSINGLVQLEGYIATDNYIDKSIIMNLGEELRPKRKVIISIRSRKIDDFYPCNLTILVLPNGDVRVDSDEEVVNGKKIMFSLSKVVYIL